DGTMKRIAAVVLSMMFAVSVIAAQDQQGTTTSEFDFFSKLFSRRGNSFCFGTSFFAACQ
ncbi:MAG: hypothetical protein ACLPMG_05140, partial [Terriglobales bacterium]